MSIKPIQDTGNVIWREMKHFSRSKAALFSTIIQPLIWLIFIGNTFNFPGLTYVLDAPNYLTFFTPGVIAMTTLFTGIFGGVSIVWDKRFGYLNKMLAAPISRTAIGTGKIISVSFRTAIQTTIIALVAILVFGVNIQTGILGLIVAILIAMLLSMAFAGISMAIGASVKNMEAMMPVMTLLTMPLLFMSSAMFPTNFMPDWMATLTRFNPVTYAIDPIRALFLNDWTQFFQLLPDLAVVAVFTITMIVMTTLLFRRSVA